MFHGCAVLGFQTRHRRSVLISLLPRQGLPIFVGGNFSELRRHLRKDLAALAVFVRAYRLIQQNGDTQRRLTAPHLPFKVAAGQYADALLCAQAKGVAIFAGYRLDRRDCRLRLLRRSHCPALAPQLPQQIARIAAQCHNDQRGRKQPRPVLAHNAP